MCPYCHSLHARHLPCPNGERRIDYLSVPVTLAEAGEDERGWEFEGLAIPYGEELQRLDWLTGATRWVFEPGSVTPTNNMMLYFGHEHLQDLGALPIGKGLTHEQTDAGLQVRMRISKTSKGRDVRELLLDEVIDRLSVGLDRTGAKTRVEDADSDDPLLVWESVPAWETSVVPVAAYNDSAKVAAVLHDTQPKGKTMHKCDKCGAELAAGVTSCPSCTAASTALAGLGITADVATSLGELPGHVEQLQRQLATLGDSIGDGSAPVAIPGRSYGEFLQMVAANDQTALDFLAFVGTTTDELVTAEWLDGTWVGDLTRRLVERRRVLNLFRTRPLPAKGMSVEHGRVLDESGVNVGEQLAEGDLLAYGKLAFDPGASSPVRTFGGWGDMSRQVIERSDAAVVELFFEALYQKYLRSTEAAAVVVATAASSAVPAQTTAATTFADADDWTDFMVDAAFALEDNGGYPLDFLMVGRDVFKTLTTLRTGPADDAPYLLDRNTGSISITGLDGNMFGVRVVPVNVAGAGLIRAGSSDAVTTYEAAGAPFRLQDDDITNLTKAFSLYGYAAFASTVPGALIRPTVAGDVA